MGFFSKYKEVIIFVICTALLIIFIQTTVTRGNRIERETKTVKVKVLE